jgi:hypothetical protein
MHIIMLMCDCPVKVNEVFVHISTEIVSISVKKPLLGQLLPSHEIVVLISSVFMIFSIQLISES